MLLLTLRETFALNKLCSFKNLRRKGGKFDHRPGRPKVLLRHCLRLEVSQEDAVCACVKTTISYLKLDVQHDGAWSSLDDALRTGALNDVQQLGLLVHVTSGRHQRRQATRQWNVLVRLERAGFRRWKSLLASPPATDMSRRQRTDVYQLVYLNTRFLLA